MKNRIVGILIIGIAILIGIIIFSFNKALSNIVDSTCTHGSTCPMWETLDFHTNTSIAIMAFIIAIGVYLIFFGKEEKIVTRFKTLRQQIEPNKITKENYKKIMSDLNSDEKQVLERIIEAQGTVFQSNLVEKTKFAKVRVSRILDKLEGRGLVERRRRGMANVVILKHS